MSVRDTRERWRCGWVGSLEMSQRNDILNYEEHRIGDQLVNFSKMMNFILCVIHKVLCVI